ncbi:kinase-like domain-containing protein [Gigaspora rosea]|uniref:Kinase-like domain-containing protein n=1 Tax=Gigaspora rosea TaxID=44941 RepID=A0A397VGA6_9GLOM|nr:kinase-like domain-containing protein [Gigaspora rosea]
MIEWIPFDRLIPIEQIGKGGFGSVYSATWLNGIRKIKKIKKTDADNNVNGNIDNNYSVDDDNVDDVNDGYSDNDDSDDDFDNHMKCTVEGSKLKIYGLTQNTETNEYLMVFQYADNGSLHKFLKENFRDLTWLDKLKLLYDIVIDLRDIHNAGYIHADFHSGNILQHKGISEKLQSYVSDLGLSKKYTENDSGGIYGVMPYVAPEVLLGQKFTKAADIYSFGVIMSEMSTGQRPFDGYEFNFDLAIKICEGLRPEFAQGTPNCYIELAKQCMDVDSLKRPDALKVYHKLGEWIINMERSNNKIKMQFLEADK